MLGMRSNIVFFLLSATWSSRFFLRAPAWTSCPTPQHGEPSREPLWESKVQEEEGRNKHLAFETLGVDSESKKARVILALPKKQGWFLLYLLAHLVHCPKQVVEVQEDEGVPHGREGAMERVRLSLLDTHHQSSLSSLLEMLLFISSSILYVHFLTLYA